jgi:hypothetical protein
LIEKQWNKGFIMTRKFTSAIPHLPLVVIYIIALLFIGSSVINAEIIRPAVVVSEEYVLNSADDTINNKGMNTPVNNGDTVESALAATHKFSNTYDSSYASTDPGGYPSDFFASLPGGDIDVDIVYDLTGGGNTDIGSIILWQYENSAGGVDRVGNQARTIEIRINTEAQGSATFSGSATTVTLLPVTDGDADPDNDQGGTNSAQLFALDSLENGRYVQLSITDNYYSLQGMTAGGDRVGLGEVRFTSWQEAVCVNPPAQDVNGDCVQDLIDFFIWVSTYLDCGFVPVSACP